jgi:hypothetical protein
MNETWSLIWSTHSASEAVVIESVLRGHGFEVLAGRDHSGYRWVIPIEIQVFASRADEARFFLSEVLTQDEDGGVRMKDSSPSLRHDQVQA